VTAVALAVSGTSLRRRAEYQRTLGKRLAEIDGALDLLEDRLLADDGASLDYGRKLYLTLREPRRNLDALLDELVRAPDEELGWQRRELEDARERLVDLVDAALAEYVLR